MCVGGLSDNNHSHSKTGYVISDTFTNYEMKGKHILDGHKSLSFMGSPPCFPISTNFVISCLLPWMMKPIEYGVYSLRKEWFLGVDIYSQGIRI